VAEAKLCGGACSSWVFVGVALSDDRANPTSHELRNIREAGGHFPHVDAKRSEAPVTDEQRFERLYAGSYDAVARYLLARTDRDSASDVLGRTFEIAWRRLADVPAEPLPWLLGVARRVLAEQRRALGRRDALIARMSETVAESSEDHAEALVARDLILSTLSTLTPLQRETLLLIVWDGLSQREAAEAMGCSRSAVAVRVHRARRELRAALARLESLPGGPPRDDDCRQAAIRPSTKGAL
jgi:RNA polymerase sigma-70 factor, ECF subfamily